MHQRQGLQRIHGESCKAHALGQTPYVRVEDLVAALEAHDHDKKPWDYDRLKYQVDKAKDAVAGGGHGGRLAPLRTPPLSPT